jgi:hypothetical protein
LHLTICAYCCFIASKKNSSPACAGLPVAQHAYIYKHMITQINVIAGAVPIDGFAHFICVASLSYFRFFVAIKQL